MLVLPRTMAWRSKAFWLLKLRMPVAIAVTVPVTPGPSRTLVEQLFAGRFSGGPQSRDRLPEAHERLRVGRVPAADVVDRRAAATAPPHREHLFAPRTEARSERPHRRVLIERRRGGPERVPGRERCDER